MVSMPALIRPAHLLPLFLLVACSAGDGEQQWEPQLIGEPIALGDAGDADGRNPTLEAIDGERYLVAWDAYRGGGGRDVFARTLSIDGELGSEHRLGREGPSGEFNVGLARNPDRNETLVGWVYQYDGVDSEGFNSLRGSILSTDGTQSEVLKLSGDQASHRNTNMTLSYDAGSKEYVVFTTQTPGGKAKAVLRRFTADGQPTQSTQVDINSTALGLSTDGPPGESLVLWRDYVLGKLYVRAFGPAGALGNRLTLHEGWSAAKIGGYDAVREQYLVTHTEDGVLIGRFVGRDGQAAGDTFPIVDYGEGLPGIGGYDLAYHSEIQSFVLVWGQSTGTLHMRTIAGDGTLGPEVSVFPFLVQSGPQLAVTGKHFAIVWQDSGGIFAQRGKFVESGPSN